MPTPHTHTAATSTLTAVRPDKTASQATTVLSATAHFRSTNIDGQLSLYEPSPRQGPRATAHEIYPVRSSPIQASQSPARHIASPSRGPQPSSSRGRGNPFAPTHGITHRSQGPNFRFYEYANPLGINTVQGIHVLERNNYTSTPPQYTQTNSKFPHSWTIGG